MTARVLGNISEGLIFVVSAPAGTGKTTLVNLLVNEFPGVVVESISYTTRPMRPGEIQGVHYHFIKESEFKEKIAKGEFLEYVKLYSHFYGTSYQAVHQQQIDGKHVVLVIDTQGALQLMGKIGAIFVFLKPPSMEVLKNRLVLRKTESENAIQERLEIAQMEIELACNYDYCIINDDLSISYQVLRSIIIAEEHRVQQVL